VGKGWTLKPFAEVGYAHDFDNSLGVGVWSAGLRTIVFWPLGRKLDLGFGTKVQYLSTFSSDLDLADEFVELRLGFDLRRELGFTIAGNQSYVSLYFIRRQWYGATIERPGFEPIELRLNNEIGLSFGTDPKVKLWFIRLPRIGLGYRWGPYVRGIRLSFGFPF